MGDDNLELEQLTDLVAGEIDRQLKTRTDVLDAMKSQMTKVIRELEEMTCNVQAKRSWMRSVGKTREFYPTSPTSAMPIHPVITSSNIAQSSPSKLPKLSGLKARKKLQQQLNRNMSGTLPPAEGVPSDARKAGGKIAFDKRLPRVANIEKRVDGLQSMLASQQKQLMYEKALVRYPQCRSNVFAPSIFDNGDDAPNSQFQTPQPAPQTSLDLDFVYGVNHGSSANTNLSQTNASGQSSAHASTSSNVFYLSTGEIMWFTASVVILYTKQTNAQRYFREHTNQVTSAAVHPNLHVVASGQIGRETFVLVWDANEDPLGKRFACLKGHAVSVRSISFSHDGKLIASLGGDMFNTICIHDWREQSLLVTARGHSFRVHTIAFNPYQAYGRPETKRGKRPGQALQDDDVCYTLVSCGVRHIRFWTLTKTEYVPPPKEENEESAFYGSSFGGPARLRPPTLHEKMWKLEGNVPSFHGRLDVQDFTSITFVDDAPPLYVYDDEAKELAPLNTNDHSLGRVIAGTAKGDLCVFWQPRRGPNTDEIAEKDLAKEPAKWWEIPDEYSDAEINELVLEKIVYEPTARLVELVPHDVATGNRFKLSKHAHTEMDGIHKRLQVKPNSAQLHTRLAELQYGGPFAHQGCTYQLAYCKKNNLVLSSGADGRLVLWKCSMTQAVRVPGVSTLGIYTPLSGSVSEGQHTLVPLDEETKVFRLPLQFPDDTTTAPTGSGIAAQPKPTSIAWKEDGKLVVVGASNNCIWELNIMTGEWSLVFEARTGCLASSSCHPAREEAATISHDGYLTLWDLRRHACKRKIFLGGDSKSPFHPSSPKPTCMEFHPFGDEIVIGYSNGELVIVAYNDLRVIKRKRIKAHVSASSTSSVESSAASAVAAPCVVQVKFDPNGGALAVGAKDTFIYVFDASNRYKKLHVCEGHSSAVIQLTWSIDADVLQSNAADGEVLFWSRANGIMKQITDGFHVRDTPWVKWSCVFGWATPGIWADDASNLVDIAAVATSGPKRGDASIADESAEPSSEPQGNDMGEDVMAVANRNTLRLFRWPASRGSKCKTYHAHSSLISSVCFAFNDRYVLTTGGDDGTLMQWKCSARAVGSVASPLRRTTKRKQQSRLDVSSDSDVNELATNPIPPPASGRSNNGSRSPRQVSRQYRERSAVERELAEDAEESSAAPRRPPSASPSPAAISQCRAKHDFVAENSDELSLTAGELVRVLSKESGEWWLGESCDGTRGIFPSSYVEEFSTPMAEAPAAISDDAVGVVSAEELSDGAVVVTPPEGDALVQEEPTEAGDDAATSEQFAAEESGM